MLRKLLGFVSIVGIVCIVVAVWISQTEVPKSVIVEASQTESNARLALIYPNQEPVANLNMPEELQVYSGNQDLGDVSILESAAYSLSSGDINYADSLTRSNLIGVKREYFFGSQTFQCGDKSIRSASESVYFGNDKTDAQHVLMAMFVGIKKDHPEVIFDGYETTVVAKAFTTFFPAVYKDGTKSCEGSNVTMYFPYKHYILSFGISATTNLADYKTRDIESDVLTFMTDWMNVMILKVDGFS